MHPPVIVIVDDESRFCDLACAACMYGGWDDVRVTMTIGIAMHCLTERAADLVLIDHRLYGVPDGERLAAWIVTQPHLAHTIRVGWTFSEPSLVSQQFDYVVSKPVYGDDHDEITLYHAVMSILQQRTTHRRAQGGAAQTLACVARPAARTPEPTFSEKWLARLRGKRNHV